MSVKKNLLNIVEQIKKYADMPPHPPSGYSAIPRPQMQTAPHSQVAPQHSAPAVISKAVQQMQLAIQNLAKTISSTIDYDALVKSMQSPSNTPGPIDQKNFEAQYGKDMFSSFMVNNYLRRADVKGVEYDTDPHRNKLLDKKPSDLKSMYIILDTLKRIGSQSSEEFADGRWGERTNNALKNISAIATAVMTLGNELGMESNAFDVDKIKELNQLIPDKFTDINQAEKDERAIEIYKIVEGVKILFVDFKQQILMNPTYRNFIEGKAPLMTIEPHKAVAEITANEKQLLDRYSHLPNTMFQFELPKEYLPAQFQTIFAGKPFDITATNLVNPQAFDQWINSNNILMNIKQNNPESFNNIVKLILNQIQSQVNQRLGVAQ